MTYPDAAEPLAQLTIERQCAARTRFVVRGQAVSLASLERAGDFRAVRCLMWIKDSSVKRRDRIPQRRYRFFRRPERFWVPPRSSQRFAYAPVSDRAGHARRSCRVVDDLIGEWFLTESRGSLPWRTPREKAAFIAARSRSPERSSGSRSTTRKDRTLVVNARDMAIKNRQPPPAELCPQTTWRTRRDLANAIFNCIEIIHDRQRRHSTLNYLSPVGHESRFEQIPISA